MGNANHCIFTGTYRLETKSVFFVYSLVHEFRNHKKKSKIIFFK